MISYGRILELFNMVLCDIRCPNKFQKTRNSVICYIVVQTYTPPSIEYINTNRNIFIAAHICRYEHLRELAILIHSSRTYEIKYTKLRSSFEDEI